MNPKDPAPIEKEFPPLLWISKPGGHWTIDWDEPEYCKNDYVWKKEYISKEEHNHILAIAKEALEHYQSLFGGEKAREALRKIEGTK